MKRGCDFIFSCILITVFIPVFAVIGLIIKVNSRGPVLFKQRRIGKGKREFYILKFRTMYMDTPRNVPTHLLENPEKYITLVGKFLRKTSLDELPQLFNIFYGEMSFVGPRPALYNQYDLIALRDEFRINDMRPGVTGWAQINGRDELEIPEKVKYDKYYLDKRSLWLDIKIVFITFYKALQGHGVVEGKVRGEGHQSEKIHI